MIFYKKQNKNKMRILILLFMTTFLGNTALSQKDYKLNVEPWYLPNEDGTGYTIQTPKLDEVLNFFQKIESAKLSDSDKTKIKQYTTTFGHYIYPKGDSIKDTKVSRLIDLLINHSDLHKAYPKVFIDFFYKRFKYFNEEQRKRISLALVEPIGLNFEKNYHVINLYHCLLYTSPSPRDATLSRMPSSA